MDYDYNMLSQMKVPELKSFLRLRGLKVGGKKIELVSRAFNAVENKLPILKTAEEIEGQIYEEYKTKLTYGEITIEDPFTMKDGWRNEEDGIKSWPLVPAAHPLRLQ